MRKQSIAAPKLWIIKKQSFKSVSKNKLAFSIFLFYPHPDCTKWLETNVRTSWFQTLGLLVIYASVKKYSFVFCSCPKPRIEPQNRLTMADFMNIIMPPTGTVQVPLPHQLQGEWHLGPDGHPLKISYTWLITTIKIVFCLSWGQIMHVIMKK